jgi:hypothetical protein
MMREEEEEKGLTSDWFFFSEWRFTVQRVWVWIAAEEAYALSSSKKQKARRDGPA